MENGTPGAKQRAGLSFIWLIMLSLTFANLAALGHQHGVLDERERWMQGVQDYLETKTRDRHTRKNHEEFVAALKKNNPDLIIPEVNYSPVVYGDMPVLPQGLKR